MSDKNNQTISEKIEQLNALVLWFEGEEFELEEALDKFEHADKLAKEIETDLDSFKAKLTVLKKDFSKE